MKINLKWKNSLSRTLLQWFLLLSLFPLMVVAVLAYTNSSTYLTQAASHQLRSEGESNVAFIKNWFHYRKVDIGSWSESSTAVTLMKDLNEDFSKNSKPLDAYVKSYAYNKLILHHNSDFMNLTYQYDYIYDIFLFDKKGNLLFTVAKEDDLGTNFLNGKYKNTKFANAIKKTMNDGKVHFSDFEAYEPSKNGVYAFCTASIIDEMGDNIGTYAIQIKPNKIIDKLSNIKAGDEIHSKHYLVGKKDGLLRTQITDSKEVLKQKIDLKFNSEVTEDVHHDELSFYTNVKNVEVIGLFHNIDIIGVKWVLVSEISQKNAFKGTRELEYKILGIVLAAILLVFLISMFVSRRIIAPLSELAEVSQLISSGVDKRAEVKTQNEIGQLADSFNKMIDELRLKEKFLEEKNKETESALEAKGEFLATMSHEIRTPMNGVIGMLSLIGKSPLSKEQSHRLSLAENSAYSLLGIINDILDFSKVEAGKLELEEISFNIGNELGDFSETISYRAQEKDVELILDFKGIERQNIIADQGRIRQILNNLVSNAIKFTKEGEIVITAVLDESDDLKGRLRISVEDSGIGIPEDKIDNLFDSFTQADTSTTREYGGTGLGLAIVKKLVELMDGKIWATSKVGKGSTFFIDIAVDLPEVRNAIMPDLKEKGQSILIVNHNVIMCKVIQEQLAVWGQKADLAHSIDEAIVMYQKNQCYDLVLVDNDIPTCEDMSFCKTMQTLADEGNLKIVLTTSMISTKIDSVIDGLNFNATLTKPLTRRDYEVLFNALDGEYILETESEKDTQNDKENEQSWSDETRILLVDDNMTNQIVANGVLELFGLQADTANDGQEALDSLSRALKTKPYTLVLMDCQMPILDGYDASRAIRNGEAGVENKDIPIVAMTANAMKGDKEKCINAGMTEYLSKPISPNKLKEMLDMFLTANTEVVETTQDVPSETIEANILEEEDTSESAVCWKKEDALALFGGMEKILVKVAAAYLKTSDEIMASLSKAVEENNLEDIRFHGHTIKGSSASIAAKKLSAMAAVMEKDAMTRDEVDTKKQFELLEEESRRVIEALKAYQNTH